MDRRATLLRGLPHLPGVPHLRVNKPQQVPSYGPFFNGSCMLIQILFERRRCFNSFKVIPLILIKLCLLVGYLTGTQIFEMKTRDGRWGVGAILV